MTRQQFFEESVYAGVLFVRTLFGIAVRPYETYRRIASKPHTGELLYIGLFVAGYFALASLVRISAFRPYMLTKEFVLLCSGMGLGYCVNILVIDTIAHKFWNANGLYSFVVGWAYTLVPTMFWFLFTSVLYVILPPPRTIRVEGILFSVLYLVVSSVLLFWKIQLGYLSVRFAYKLDAIKISILLICMAPVWAVYAVGMYLTGIFKVPFI